MAQHFTEELMTAAEEFVRDSLQSADASHDFAHVDRVRKNARLLARCGVD